MNHWYTWFWQKCYRFNNIFFPVYYLSQDNIVTILFFTSANPITLQFHNACNYFQKFYQIFTFYDPLSQVKRFLRKCLSVDRILNNSRWNYRTELSFVILYRSRKSKDKFVNQSHRTKIVKIRAFLIFLKKSLWKNPKLQYW